MKQTTDAQVMAWLADEFAHPFTGWDFSYLSKRRKAMGSLPWDYTTIAKTHLARANSVLDIDTGGGEVFAEILNGAGFTGKASALEPYSPNALLAQQRLTKQGVKVYDTSQHPANLEDASFDLVLSRHGGSITPSEIQRLLKRDGNFVTEQIGNRTNRELRELFGVEHPQATHWPRNAEAVQPLFSNLGFEVLQLDSHAYNMRFMDVGAISYYLKAVPWEVPGFNLNEHGNRLLKLHRETVIKGYALDSTYHAYVMVLKKTR